MHRPTMKVYSLDSESPQELAVAREPLRYLQDVVADVAQGPLPLVVDPYGLSPNRSPSTPSSSAARLPSPQMALSRSRPHYTTELGGPYPNPVPKRPDQGTVVFRRDLT
jgi:hypothetical protein